MKSLACAFASVLYRIILNPSENLEKRISKMIENTYLVAEKDDDIKQSIGVRTLRHVDS